MHGVVLAGGKSSRMGQDKALLEFRGQPMVERAVETLREFCACVSIAGNRDDLWRFAPVVREQRLEAGPVAGIESALKAAEQPWVMLMPVDMPLIPVHFLRVWAQEIIGREDIRATYLRYDGQSHPALCLLRAECAEEVSEQVEAGERRIQKLLESLAGFVVSEAEFVAAELRAQPSEIACWLTNVNYPDEFAAAQSLIDR